MKIRNILKILYIINLLVILECLFYITHLTLLLKKSNYGMIYNEKNKNNKDELLNMCYKSRSLIYSKLRKINESNLVTIQEKLNYLLVHESPDYKSKIADKILVHNYSISKLGKDICVPIIKIYNDSNEIKLEELPDKFVLKCNHGSAMNIICKNKSDLNIDMVKKNLDTWKNTIYGLKSSEFQYLNIDRKIFAEKFLKENIEDYKIYCFEGVPKFIRVQKHFDGIDGKINNYYDLNWNLTEIETGIEGFYRRPELKFEKPKNFDLMIEYAKKLSEEFVFVRVDLYNVNGKIYLGEMTFSPSNLQFSLKNKEQSIELGKLININNIKNYLFN